jgi:hypothetical protein
VALRELNQRTLSGSVFEESAVWMTPFSFLIEFALKGSNDGRSAQMRHTGRESGCMLRARRLDECNEVSV